MHPRRTPWYCCSYNCWTNHEYSYTNQCWPLKYFLAVMLLTLYCLLSLTCSGLLYWKYWVQIVLFSINSPPEKLIMVMIIFLIQTRICYHGFIVLAKTWIFHKVNEASFWLHPSPFYVQMFLWMDPSLNFIIAQTFESHSNVSKYGNPRKFQSKILCFV